MMTATLRYDGRTSTTSSTTMPWQWNLRIYQTHQVDTASASAIVDELSPHDFDLDRVRSLDWQTRSPELVLGGRITNHADESRTDGSHAVENELLDGVKSRLLRIGELEVDWDSYGAQPPDPRAIDETLLLFGEIVRILGNVAGERVRPTSISPLPPGGIELEWRSPSQTLAIDVDPYGKWGYLRKTGAGRGVEYEEGTNIPRERLISLLAEVLLPLHRD